MDEDGLELGGAFPAVDRQAWRALVEASLKGAPFEKRLVTRTYDGLAIQPLYTREDWSSAGDPSGFPGLDPFVRGSRAEGAVAGGWDVRQPQEHPDLAAANRAILADLEGGATSIQLRFDAALRRGLDADAPKGLDLAGLDGVTAATLDDLDRLLAGVLLDLAPVALQAGAAFLPAAALLAALWRRRGIADADAKGAFDADPLGALAALGELPQGLDAALAEAAALAGAARRWPGVTALAVDSGPYHDAGASEAQDLGLAMATGVAYLRALTAAGLSVDEASRQIAFTVPTGTELFIAIAKLRAGRKLWARIVEASGGSPAARGTRQRAVAARRVLSRRDAWVNMLRTTVTCFAGAVGGADSVTVLSYEAAIGVPSDFGRRIARNTQLVLMEESSLAKVIDPAGGAWYVERLTEELARAAWAELQAVEAAGGMAAALQSGFVAERIGRVREERAKNLARRRDPLTGVSEFAFPAEPPVEAEAVDLAAVRREAAGRAAAARGRADAGRLAGLAPGADVFTAAVEAAAAGATVGQMTERLAGTASRVEPLPVSRFAEMFEELRDAADAWKARQGAPPRVFLANLGSLPDYAARAMFSRNFFGAGGIETVDSGGHAGAAAAAAAFRASGAAIAAICSSDALYAEHAEATARALKAAGAGLVYLAGQPGERRAALEAAGIDRFAFLGADVPAALREALAHLGVIEP